MAHRPNSVSLLLLGVTSVWRTSENAVKANFGEYPFHPLEAWPKSPREQGLSTLLSGTDEEVLVMLGKRSGQNGSDHPYLDHVGRDSFYGFLALHQRELFRDEHFADLYCSDNGRPSVPRAC